MPTTHDVPQNADPKAICECGRPWWAHGCTGFKAASKEAAPPTPACAGEHNKLRDICAGLEIFANYPGCSVSAETDALCAGAGGPAVTDDERKQLEAAGWVWDEITESWMIFV